MMNFLRNLTQSNTPCVPPADAYSAISTQHGTLIDIREAAELKARCIPVAVHFPLSQFAATRAQFQQLPKPWYVICASGGRSGNLVDQLVKEGQTEVFSVSGGIMQWGSEGLPTA